MDDVSDYARGYNDAVSEMVDALYDRIVDFEDNFRSRPEQVIGAYKFYHELESHLRSVLNG